MASDIDVQAIASFSSLPESTVNTLLDSPTIELVKSLLSAIEIKARDYEQSKSRKIKLEVELETYIRTSESKTKVLQKSRDKALADVSQLRADVQNAEVSKSRVESELERLKQADADESTELATLTSRISSLEASNRDTLALLETKTSAHDRLTQELSSQHQKIVELRKQNSALEQSNQTANSAVASARFREQSLQQELELSRKNNDWLENERKIKSEEHTSFRKEKNLRISELARSNEHYIEEAEVLRRSETTLKTRLDEQISKNEDMLQEIQKLREKETADANSHRIELDSVNRLAQLQEASANTAKQRVQELSAALEEVKEEAIDEIGRIRAEVEAEHHDKEAAEQRVNELEARIVETEHEMEQVRAMPATPRREVNLNGLSTPQRLGTPTGTFTPVISNRLKSGSGTLTISQLYGEYKNLERELAIEKRLNTELQGNVDSMLEDLESKRPEIEELREDQTRLQSEVFEMSTLVETANQERDTAMKDARIMQGQFEALSKELEECKQVLRDRNSQVRWLVMDRQAREHGDSISEEQFEQLKEAAADADKRDSSHLSETQQVVNQRLVLFKSIEEMQKQNENQLITIRQVVSELESARAQETRQKNMELTEELEAMKTKIVDYQAEIQHMVNQSKSFVTERDMFKNMLTKRGQLPANVNPTDFSRSLPLPRAEDEIASSGGNDYAKLLKDLQAHFDNYRHESASDTTALRSQMNEVTKRNSQLQTDFSRVQAQLSSANERYEMLSTNFNMMKAENAEIQKRSYAAMEATTKQELKTQQAAEDLIEAQGLLDGLRRESANLKAEKDLWKSVEKRLIEDNESLRNERSRVDQLNSSLQNILNEREQTDSETRRRLQMQVESLENELQSTKRKLNEELEDSKNANLRREYDYKQSQQRIDDLVSSLSTTREELASTKTSRDHLHSRGDELTVELRSAEERLDVLTKARTEAADQTNGAAEDTLSREQELAVEVSELKRDLELKINELERANEQIEVYKSIAQSAEERLQELTETNDQFKAVNEAAISERDDKIKDLQQRIDDISSELNTTNSELTALRDEQSESNRKLDDQKSAFEAEMTRLKEAAERSAEQAQFNLEASKVQAEIATEAQQNYDNELVRHAEAAKNLQAARGEANQLRLQMVDLKTKADTAHGDLEQKEASWSDMRDRYEQEITDLKTRREEVARQNSLLHNQLESLTQQITALQRDRASLAVDEQTSTVEGGDKARGDLQEVIKYLRREKEIVDVQYHLSTQEAKRLRQQLDFAQSQLDDTRLKLDQQRRAEADTERNAMSHDKLMDTLNELNLYRESSVTLRAEAKHATQLLAEKTKRVDELEQQLQPLQARIAELENLGELREGEMKLLQTDRDHWQQRCQNILSKYDRVDPAELEALKSKLTELEKEKDEAITAQQALQAEIDSHPEQIKVARGELKDRLTEQFKERSKKLSATAKEKQNEIESLQAELETVKEQLEATRREVTNADSANGDSAPNNSSENSTATAEAQVRIDELQAKVTELETALVTKDKAIATTSQQADEKLKASEAQMRERLNKRLSEYKQEVNTAKENALEELRQKLAAEHQQEIEVLRAQSIPVATELQNSAVVPSSNESENPAPPTDSAPPPAFEKFAESITEDQAKQLININKTLRSIMSKNIESRVTKRLEAARQEQVADQPTSDVQPGASDELQKRLEAEKEQLLQQKEQEFAAEKDAMAKEFSEKLDAERQALIAQKDQQFAHERLEFSKEAEKKIAEQIANAQALAEKKANVKLSMATNRALMAVAKIEVVQKAAEDTPERAVKEVWDVAKVAKPAPQQAQQPKPVAVQPTNAAKQATNPSAPVEAAPVPVVADVVPNGSSNGTGGPEPTSTQATGESDGAVAADSTAKPTPVNASTTPTTTNAPKSGIPQVRGAHRGGRGGVNTHQTQPGPVAATQAPAVRGTGIPRGRGGARGGQRGALQTGAPTTSGGQRGGGMGSPVRGALNASAQQFVPGSQKRPREDSEGGGDASAGKRIRGGSTAGT